MSWHWLRIGPGASDAASHERLFVAKITVRQRHRWRSIDGFIIGGWSLILGKCALASLAIRHWEIPIADVYVWGPSILLGAVCTALYLSHREE